MYLYLLLFLVFAIIVSFVFYVLSLMKLTPILIAAPILFILIVITIQMITNRNRFRGFKH
jgi:hypothetical protein